MKKFNKPSTIFLLLYLAYSAIYVVRLNLSIATPVMESLRLIDKTQVGYIGSLFFFTYSFGQLFNGNLGDKIRPKIMILSGLLVAAICNLIIGLLPPVIAIIILWGLNGYAQSMVWGPMLRILSANYDEKKLSATASLFGTSVAIGSIAGIVISSYVTTSIGVCYAFYIPGAIILLTSILVAVLLRAKEPPANHINRIPLNKIFTHNEVAPVLLPAIVHGIIKDNINMWAPVYFIDMFGIDLKKASFFVFLIPAIGLAAKFTIPFFYKICGNNEKTLAGLGFVICIALAVPLCLPNIPIYVAAICLSGIAAMMSVINTSFLSLFPMKFSETGNVSSIAGVMDFVTYMGAGVSSLVYGYVLEYGNYSYMYISWIVISIFAVTILVLRRRKENAKILNS